MLASSNPTPSTILLRMCTVRRVYARASQSMACLTCMLFTPIIYLWIRSRGLHAAQNVCSLAVFVYYSFAQIHTFIRGSLQILYAAGWVHKHVAEKQCARIQTLSPGSLFWHIDSVGNQKVPTNSTAHFSARGHCHTAVLLLLVRCCCCPIETDRPPKSTDGRRYEMCQWSPHCGIRDRPIRNHIHKHTRVRYIFTLYYPICCARVHDRL